jgi:glycosidase/fibronectin type 3 domain-containing protein
LVTALSVVTILVGAVGPVPVLADHTPNPTSVTIAGSLQDELGCPGDWQPECAATHLAYDGDDAVWQGMFTVPAGSWEYKAPLNDSWSENYGLYAIQDGANIPLNLGASTSVKFYYDHESHWVTDNQNSVIAVAPGSFQSELGCPGDWQADCLRSWLQDPDGDGIYSFSTTALPVGNYEAKVALNESWDVNYGQGGVQNGPNIPFSVPAVNSQVTFTYDPDTHILSIHVISGTTATLVGSLQSELGCSGDWDPTCTATDLLLDPADDVYQRVFNVPAGDYEYKVAIDHDWAENYGLHGVRDGSNIPFNLGAPTAVKFYYDHKSHWITDNQSSVIAVAPGSFQSELGCAGDWDPGCLRSWLQDPDENEIYEFTTTAIPAGNYEGKVAINESWDENYGAGGAPGGANLAFTVPFDGAEVKFTYYSVIHLLTITTPGGLVTDNNVEWDGLRHNSRDPLYRTPGGAVAAGTPVLIRFRTFHSDVTGVSLRVYDINANGQKIIPMTLAASDVSCYQVGLESESCDFWQATLNEATPNNLWYRFIVADGSDTDYYDDNTPALDGGLGAPTDEIEDHSFALMVYEPDFTAPDWAKSASIYQIFPDRFNNDNPKNDPQTGDIRYDDPVIALPWSTLPEGYCRNYADGNINCPWRFDAMPPPSSPNKEQPRGRDYYGGDLRGVTQKLDYLKDLGITTIYFNPIFDAGSNHSYDTQDYYTIDPYFGTQGDFQKLVTEARQRDIRIVLDGVFNHMSSDSPFFDRYHHYDTIGACESADSPYRAWFNFRAPAGNEPSPCAPSTPGGNDTYYEGWFGFDSIPVINKTLPEVQAYFLTGEDSVSRYWLHHGAAGWRLDVSGDASFPNGYWETFREVTKSTDPDALLISETWQKDSTLLRMIRGDRLDTTMNYRLRDAVIGLLAPGPFDSKGFADSGRIISPSEFAARMESIREDYPDAAYYSLMNLLDSHDTERLRWTLTPGEETTASKELNALNVAEGKTRQQLASLIQFTVPGAPTVFYGDEVGVTGDDDPDDRRTYPWADEGGLPDQAMFDHYQALNALRTANSVLTDGDFRILLADDASGVVAYGRKTSNRAALIIVNRSDEAQTGAIPVAGYLPDGVTLNQAYAVGDGGAGSVAVVNGKITGTIGPMSAVIFLSGNVDLQPTAAPANLHVTDEGSAQVSLAWNSVSGATGYSVYRSPLSGGGFVKVGDVAGTSFTDTGLQNARTYFYVVTALDNAGNESENSNEVSALPHLTIGWANLQWPPTMTHTISVVDRTDTAYGQVWIDGVTNLPGATESLRAQLGFGPTDSNPAGNPAWTWVEASFNVDAGNNDEFMASMLPDAVGTYDYVYRYTTTNGRDWLYADLNGPIPDGALPPNPGELTVVSGSDTTAPATPTGLHVVSASPAGIELAWDAITGDPTLYGYEVRRSDTSGGLYTTIALVTGTSYTDAAVVENATYYYVVRSVDLSFNRSSDSGEVEATAELRTVTLVFNVTVPASTDGTGRSVYIAGFLDRLDGGYPQWDPGGVVLTRLDATHWTITFTGRESTQIEYKYTLGDWDHVEKDGACGEIANRQLTLSYGATGTQTVNDVVPNWRNVSPCGN